MSNRTKLPVCNINIYTKPFTSWNVSGFNLLNTNVREEIVNNLGKNVCGNLLNGSTNSIQEIKFYNKTLDNKETLNSDFEKLIEHVDIVNSLIQIPNNEDGILSILDAENTKGVFWKGTQSPSKLIDLLNSNYTSTTNMKLSADGRTGNAHVWLTNDSDGIVFADVNLTVTADFNGQN